MRCTRRHRGRRPTASPAFPAATPCGAWPEMTPAPASPTSPASRSPPRECFTTQSSSSSLKLLTETFVMHSACATIDNLSGLPASREIPHCSIRGRVGQRWRSHGNVDLCCCWSRSDYSSSCRGVMCSQILTLQRAGAQSRLDWQASACAASARTGHKSLTLLLFPPCSVLALNPGLDCQSLKPGQLVCTGTGAAPTATCGNRCSCCAHPQSAHCTSVSQDALPSRKFAERQSGPSGNCYCRALRGLSVSDCCAVCSTDQCFY